MGWDGVDRRRKMEDHDLLTKIDSKLDYLLESYASHIKDDKETFEKHNQRISYTEKVIYIGFGVIACLEIFLKFIK